MQASRLPRTLVAQEEKIEDCQDHMEEISTIDEARPAILAMIHEESWWRLVA